MRKILIRALPLIVNFWCKGKRIDKNISLSIEFYTMEIYISIYISSYFMWYILYILSIMCLSIANIWGNVQNRYKAVVFEVLVVRLASPLATRISLGFWLHKAENLPFIQSGHYNSYCTVVGGRGKQGELNSPPGVLWLSCLLCIRKGR